MQLSFDAADRLVELVEARHGPVAAEDAARELYALRHVPAGLARSLLSDVVDGDARLAWRGGSVALAAPPGAALALEDATYVVVRPRDDRPLARLVRDLRDRRRARPRARARGALRDAREPAPAAAGADRGADGDRSGRASGSAAGRAGRAPLPRVRRRRRARRPQRPLRHGLPRPRGRAAHGPSRRVAGRRHGLARAAAARGPPEARRPRLARLLLRHGDPAVPPRARGLGGDGGDPARADRPRAGAGRRDGGAARRSLRAAGASARGQALARRRSAAAPGRLPLPRPQRPGALRRSRPRPARAAALVLPHRAAAAGGRGRARRARAGRVAGPRLGARGGARGAAAAPRAAPAGERAQRTPRPLRLPPPPRRGLVRHGCARALRAAQEPAARSGRGPRARRLGR